MAARSAPARALAFLLRMSGGIGGGRTGSRRSLGLRLVLWCAACIRQRQGAGEVAGDEGFGGQAAYTQRLGEAVLAHAIHQAAKLMVLVEFGCEGRKPGNRNELQGANRRRALGNGEDVQRRRLPEAALFTLTGRL